MEDRQQAIVPMARTRAHGIGDMGKFQIISRAMGLTLLVAFTLTGGSAEARKHSPKIARVLPSQVKSISMQSPRKREVAGPTKLSAMANEDFSPELQNQARENPWASKYYSRTVYYVRADVSLPESYNCDAETESRKKQEAERQAQEKCQDHGQEDCRLAKVVISKNGVLRCQDFPGKKCPGSGHFRGCVAEALVLGEKVTSVAVESH